MIQQLNADALLAGELGQWLAQQGGARAEAKRKSWRRVWIALVPGLSLAVLIGVATQSFQVPIMIAIFTVIGGLSWAAAAQDPIKRAIKAQMNSRIAHALGLQFSAGCQPGPAFHRAREFELLPNHHRAAFEDLWWGDVSGTNFSIYEAHLQEWQQRGKRRVLVDVFRGSIMTLDFKRRFHGTTLVERSNSRITFFGLRDSIEKGGVKLDRVTMVDPRFAEDFWVWSTDAVEAHYLVHPAYVERLIGVEQAFNGQKIRALFQGGQLVIVLNSGNMFETGGLDPNYDRVLLTTCIQQFSSLANLAVQLNEAPRGNFAA